MAKTAVVLGAGPGGLAAAERLRKTLQHDDRVVLIDTSFVGNTGLSALRVLRGWSKPDTVTTIIRPEALPRVELVTGEVTAIDAEARRVTYSGAGSDETGTVGYDALIVALGAALNTAAVPGLDAAIAAGSAGEFYSVAGADALHHKVSELQSGRVVVLVPATPFKCPPAPYEAAFMIADLAGQRFTGGAVRVDLITCEPAPIGVARANVGAGLVELLTERGIGFLPARTGATVDAPGDGRPGAVSFDDGSTEPFDLLAAVPVHTSPAATLLPHLVNAGGWLPVDERTMAVSAPGAPPGVWAVGDCTAPATAHGKPLPKAGFLAEAGGVAAADQAARHLGAGAPETHLDGEGGCILEIGGIRAAKIAGQFLATPEPDVVLLPPAERFHDEKAALEREWVTRWG